MEGPGVGDHVATGMLGWKLDLNFVRCHDSFHQAYNPCHRKPMAHVKEALNPSYCKSVC